MNSRMLPLSLELIKGGITTVIANDSLAQPGVESELSLVVRDIFSVKNRILYFEFF